MKKIFFLLIFLLTFATFSMAHLGSSGVLMQAQNGPYKILVDIKPPDVIPGTAKVVVFFENTIPERVLVRPVYFLSGSQGSPLPEEIFASADQPARFEGEVWLMETGSSSIQMRITGREGEGNLTIPIAAVSTAQKQMPAGLGFGLGVLALTLFVLMVTIIGACGSDAVNPPGAYLPVSRRRQKIKNMLAAAAICSIVMYAGKSWWQQWEANYRAYLYKPLGATATISTVESKRKLQLKIDTAALGKQDMLNTLVPDHGKLMHAFLVRIPAMDAFAHVHPERTDLVTFESMLPDLPAGRYLVYADMVQYSGFTETVTDTLEIPERSDQVGEYKKTAQEDSYIITDPIQVAGKRPVDENFIICGKPGSKTVLKDSSFIVWEGTNTQAWAANSPYLLNFEVFNADGSAAKLEPYLGMMAHAAVFRSDGSVYIHLHPSGTFSMAAGQSLESRLRDTSRISVMPSPIHFRDSIDRYLTNLKFMPEDAREALISQRNGPTPVSHRMDTGAHGNRVSFPYAFPREGQYRIFVQVKMKGEVLTGAFDLTVVDPQEM